MIIKIQAKVNTLRGLRQLNEVNNEKNEVASFRYLPSGSGFVLLFTAERLRVPPGYFDFVSIKIFFSFMIPKIYFTLVIIKIYIFPFIIIKIQTKGKAAGPSVIFLPSRLLIYFVSIIIKNLLTLLKYIFDLIIKTKIYFCLIIIKNLFGLLKLKYIFA